MDSDDEVQEIDPPVIIQSGRKKYRWRTLTEEFDISFCHCSKKNRKNAENSILAEASHNAALDR
jgi:hypothetical protein